MIIELKNCLYVSYISELYLKCSKDGGEKSFLHIYGVWSMNNILSVCKSMQNNGILALLIIVPNKKKSLIKIVFFRADHYISTPVWSKFFLSPGILDMK